MSGITLQNLRRFAPRAACTIRMDIVRHLCVLSDAGIDTAPGRLCHFMAQIAHESAGLTRIEENLNYRASRLKAVWPRRFPGNLAETLAGDPVAIANHVYADRLGNGTADSGDGWRYRGRGFLQLTGRANYRRYGEKIGVDLEAEPGRAAEPGTALRIAAAYWTDRGCNTLADRDDLRAITRRINGGLNGFADRRRWLVRARKVWA